ncbi:hypothetical protein RFI_15901, partial [Reticulomyxa filosa]
MIDHSLDTYFDKLADVEKRKGNQCYSKGQYHDALLCYKKAQQLNPNHPAYLVNQAVTYYMMDELIDAKNCCIQAIEIGRRYNAHPQWNAKAFSTLAHVAFKQNNIANCIRFYRLSLTEYQDQKINDKLQQVFIISEFGDQAADVRDLFLTFLFTNKQTNLFICLFGSDADFWNNVLIGSDESGYRINPPSSIGDVPILPVVSGANGSLALAAIESPEQLTSILHKLQKDAFIVLEELCRLAAKQQVD